MLSRQYFLFYDARVVYRLITSDIRLEYRDMSQSGLDRLSLSNVFRRFHYLE